MHLPGTRVWESLTEYFKHPARSKHVFQVFWSLGETFSKGLQNFAIEHVAYYPGYIFHKMVLGIETASELSYANLLRTRIFRFYDPPTLGRAKLISPVINPNHTATPFIEARWRQDRITEIGMFGFSMVNEETRSMDAKSLSLGMELLRRDLSRLKLLDDFTEGVKIKNASGRHKDSGIFKQTDFKLALEDSLRALKAQGVELCRAQLLYKLYSNPLNKNCKKGETDSLEYARRNKTTLSRWLKRAGLSWADVVEIYHSLP